MADRAKSRRREKLQPGSLVSVAGDFFDDEEDADIRLFGNVTGTARDGKDGKEVAVRWQCDGKTSWELLTDLRAEKPNEKKKSNEVCFFAYHNIISKVHLKLNILILYVMVNNMLFLVRFDTWIIFVCFIKKNVLYISQNIFLPT